MTKVTVTMEIEVEEFDLFMNNIPTEGHRQFYLPDNLEYIDPQDVVRWVYHL